MPLIALALPFPFRLQRRNPRRGMAATGVMLCTPLMLVCANPQPGMQCSTSGAQALSPEPLHPVHPIRNREVLTLWSFPLAASRDDRLQNSLCTDSVWEMALLTQSPEFSPSCPPSKEVEDRGRAEEVAQGTSQGLSKGWICGLLSN